MVGMKSGFLIVNLLFACLTALGQIDMTDSTVQVITYWDEGEKRNYTVTLEKIILKEADTLLKELTKYDVEVAVLKADDTSYTIQWDYNNFTSDSQNPIMQKLVRIRNNLKVVFKIDEFGAIMGVVNWKEISNYIHKALAKLGKELKDHQGADEFIKQTQNTYSTKEAIEAGSMLDIQQFHTFHGVSYKLGEKLGGSYQVPNLFNSAEPFNATSSFYLDEINVDEDNYTLQAKQEISEDQMKKATFEYLTKLANLMNTNPPTPEDVGGVGDEVIFYTSKLNGYGWVEHSVQKKMLKVDNITNMTERIIMLK